MAYAFISIDFQRRQKTTRAQEKNVIRFLDVALAVTLLAWLSSWFQATVGSLVVVGPFC